MTATPNLIIHNGTILTMAHDKPQVQAVATLNGRIIATGADHEILPLGGPGTKIINLNGAMVVPGLNDAHNHMLEVGIKMTRIALDECKSLEEMRNLIADAAKNTRKDVFAERGGSNFEGKITGETHPDKDLDDA